MPRAALILGLCAVLLSACKPDISLFKTTRPVETIYVEVPLFIRGPAMDYHKRAILKYVRNHFKDPYSIRDAEISHYGIQAEHSTRERTIVCVQLNAKNGFGGYVGRSTVQFEFGGRGVRSATEDHPQCTEMNGDGLKYGPFPELEALSRL